MNLVPVKLTMSECALKLDRSLLPFALCRRRSQKTARGSVRSRKPLTHALLSQGGRMGFRETGACWSSYPSGSSSMFGCKTGPGGTDLIWLSSSIRSVPIQRRNGNSGARGGTVASGQNVTRNLRFLYAAARDNYTDYIPDGL